MGPACNKIWRVVLKLGLLNLRATSIHVHSPDIVTAPTTETMATGARRDEVLTKLGALLKESRRTIAEAKTRDSFEYGEQRLTRWKSRVVRFLDSNISYDEGISFMSIRTAESAASNMGHLLSSFAGHSTFLEALMGEIEADDEFPVKPEQKPSGTELPQVKGFSYSQ